MKLKYFALTTLLVGALTFSGNAKSGLINRDGFIKQVGQKVEKKQQMSLVEFSKYTNTHGISFNNALEKENRYLKRQLNKYQRELEDRITETLNQEANIRQLDRVLEKYESK